MTTDEIRPKQLRALLLLLFLVPLIPTAMMARFMVDALRGERSMAAERLEQSYSASLTAALANPEGTDTGSILGRIASFTDAFVTVRIVGEKGESPRGETGRAGNGDADGGGLGPAVLVAHPVLERAGAGKSRFGRDGERAGGCVE